MNMRILTAVTDTRVFTAVTDKRVFATVIVSCLIAACATVTETPAPPDSVRSVETATPALPEGMRLVETVERVGDEIVIPYEKFVLDNGLTVILHEDHSDPLVHVDVTYHVGSAREEIGKSGFAHFFEHMMFQGSENVADEQHIKIVSESGGRLNGTTSRDRTNYYQTVPKNQLEKILWLEADRMGFLLPAVTIEKFEIQRDTVKNERAQNYENKPYGLLHERLVEALYPEGHPYSWLPIGYVEDLNRVNVNDLKAFFLRWYGPNNAILTIGGDFDRAETLRWIDKYFGPIPRGPAVEPMEKAPAVLDADRYISMEDNVKLPLLSKSLPTVYFRHPDEAALDALANILGQGQNSLFYQNIEKTKIALSATASHSCDELSCTFGMGGMPSEGHTIDDVKQAIEESLREFETRGVTDDDLARFKNRAVSNSIFGLQSVAGKVSYLAIMETLTGNPNDIGANLERVEAVTKADVMRVYEQYVKDKPALFLRIVPKGEGDSLRIPDNWTFPGRTIPQFRAMNETDLTYRHISDDFDRSVLPPSGPPPARPMLDSWSDELANGIDVSGTHSDETPTTIVVLRTRTGQQHEPAEKRGVADLTAKLLKYDTLDSTGEALNNRLGKLGSAVTVYSDGEYTVISLSALTRNLDETLDIAAERLFRPKFDPAEFERIRGRSQQLLQSGDDFADYVANKVLQLLLFGEDNNFAHPSIGSEETLEAVTVEDVRAFYERHYSPSVTEIVAVSDLPQDRIVAKLDARFGDWQAKPVAGENLQPYPELEGGTIYLVDKPEAKQSEIRVANRSLTYDATGEHFRLNLLNYPFGQAFNGRLNLNLREDKGYTYGAVSTFLANEYSGRFFLKTAVRNDVTADAIAEIMKEIDGFAREGMTEAELAFTRSAIGQNDALAYESLGQKASILALNLRYDLDPAWPLEQHEILMSVPLQELNALAAEHFQPDDMIILVVGDKDALLEELRALGRPVVELDTSGQRVGLGG